MKVLEISSAYPPSRGGVETVVSELSSRLAARGHTVSVLTSSRGLPSRRSDGYVGRVRVIRFPERLHLFEAPLIPQIAMRALFMDYDILHVHGMVPSISDFAVLAGKLRGKRVVVTYHNDAESTLGWGVANLAAKVYAMLSVPILRWADSVVSTTRSYAETSMALKHLMSRVEFIPLGVDLARFAGTGSTRPSSIEKKEILFVGQLKDYKGVSFLIQAVDRLRRAGVKVNLNVAGSGPSLPKLRKMAQSLGLGDSVRFCGNVEEAALISLYDSCDLVVLPSISRREAFGLVQLEASAAGRVVVATDIPGAGDVARMVGGYLARPSDPDSLALQLMKALGASHDPIKLKNTAGAMSWDVVATEYEELFLSLLEKDGPLAITPPQPAEPQVPAERGLPQGLAPTIEEAEGGSHAVVSERFTSPPLARLGRGLEAMSGSLRRFLWSVTAGAAAVLGSSAFVLKVLAASADQLGVSADASTSYGESASILLLAAVLFGFIAVLLRLL